MENKLTYEELVERDKMQLSAIFILKNKNLGKEEKSKALANLKTIIGNRGFMVTAKFKKTA